MKTSFIALAACLAATMPATTMPAWAAETPAADDAADAAPAIIVVGQTNAPIEIEPRGLAVSLGDEQFAAINAMNTEDLMKYAPNFFVRKRYAGDSNGVPGFRGTHSTQSARTLVMVDGFVVSNFLGNSFSFSPKWGVIGPAEVEQFDIVYGPYSSRYVGNSMGGIVNITTRNPEDTEAFVKVQGMVQPYKQFGTDDAYWGGSIEGGVGLKQKDGPFSVRVTGRYFRNDGHPMSFLGLTPVTGATGTVVTGAIVDPGHVRAAAEGTAIPSAPGSATNPYFAAQSPAAITQAQGKVKVGYDDGNLTGQFLFAYWHNEDKQLAPDCYLRDAAGNVVCEGRVTIGTQTYTASGANFSKTIRDEYLVGLKLAAPFGESWNARLALSTYQIAKSDGFTSNGYIAGQNNGAGTLNEAGPTGWYTGDLTIENKGERNELAFGLTASLYQTDTLRTTTANWQSKAGKTFATQTFGKTRILSAWAEDKLHATDALTFSLGLRFDDWRAFDGGLGRLGTGTQAGQQVFNRYAARHETAVNPTASVQYAFADGTLAQLSLAMATRFPTVGELFQGSLNGDGTFNVNSFDPNLKPERSKDANFLVSHDFGAFKLTGSAFYQRVRNTLFQFLGFNQNNVSTSNYKNIELTRQFGFEAIAETRDWPVEGISIEANAAYIDSKTLRNPSNTLAEGVQFPRIPKWRINGNVRYDITPAVQASLGMRYASRPNTDLFGLQRGDTFGFTSELFALDAKLNWNVTEQIRASVGVDNLTNSRAWVFHPYPLRTVLVELGWKM
ncbi:TonB-dependent receptor [Novosphingobium sp. ERN07]|uniref:TonB-dependent receptor n=1 Tax=Novosphingobium sp. ERN07 TaxID=2726187 RepID=UPI001F10BF8C|nr:TonB-dependent receptor [Novosphingobium sp. ERN07]